MNDQSMYPLSAGGRVKMLASDREARLRDISGIEEQIAQLQKRQQQGQTAGRGGENDGFDVGSMGMSPYIAEIRYILYFNVYHPFYSGEACTIRRGHWFTIDFSDARGC